MTRSPVVLIGCGSRGRAHARALAASDRFDLTAVCDLDADRARETAAAVGVEDWYTDLDEAIPAAAPSHVSCVTPPTVRASIVEAVLDHDVGSVLVEKPPANTLDELREIRAVKRWLDAGRLGEVRRLIGTTKGGLAAQGSHFLHMLDWLVGATPATVRAFAEGPRALDPERNPHVPGHSEPEDTVVELAYGGGERAFCHFGPAAPDEPAKADSYWLEYRLDVVGTEGHASFVHGDHARAVLADGTTERIDARDFDEDAYMTRGLYDALGAVLAGERASHPADLESALAVARTADAAVDLWAVSAFADHVDLDDPAAVRADLDRHGLELPVVSVFDDPPIEEKLDAAAELGADTVVMGGRTPARPDTFDPDRLGGWLDRAADRGLTLAFENHLDTLETVDEMAALLDALDHEAAAICLAPTHLRIAGGRVEEALARLGEDVAVVYLWDVEPGLGRDGADAFWWERADSQVPGGGGGVDFGRLLELAVEHCPEAHWTMCYHGTEEWSTGRIRQSVARGLRHVEPRRP